MAKINLLPWRQELRTQRKQEFLVINMAVALVALVLLLFFHMLVSSQIGDQEEQKAFIKSEIVVLDKQIAEIDELQKRKDELLARMKVIQDLQGRRPVIVRVFDDLVRAVPDKLFLKLIERKENKFTITGVAESNNQVATFLRNLNASAWFKNPVLASVTSSDTKQAGTKQAGAKGASDKPKTSDFTLTVELEAPESGLDETSASSKKSNKAKKEAAK